MIKVLENEMLVDVQRVASLTGFSVRTIQRWSATGEHDFPKPLKLGRLIRWRVNDVQAWVEKYQNQ